MKHVLFFICLISLGACKNYKDPNEILVESNFDGIEGWDFSHPSLTTERAHSGKYSLKIDGGNEFSLAFKQILGKLTNKKPKQINVEFWAYIPDNSARANFVCTIEDPKTNKSKFWQGFNLVDKTADYREWVKINKRLELPADTELSDRFSCYLWRPEASSETVYIDDLKITILE